jgi:hypothetical protein
MDIPTFQVDPIYRGDDWGVVLRVKNPDKTVRNLTGAHIDLELREDPTIETVVVTPLAVVTSGLLGEIWLTITGFDTKQITQSTLYGTVFQVSATGREAIGFVTVEIREGDDS